MKEIAPDILIETDYQGVTVGVVRTPDGICLVDFPLLPKEIQTWQTVCTREGSGSKRLTVLLDDHPDRAGGCKDSRSPVITHTHTANVLHGRPGIAKMQGMETGNMWELIPTISMLEWPQPEITFSHSLSIAWAGNPITIENHPGPTIGALWVDLPESRVLFVGDAVMPDQPPFLFAAQITPWIENLDLLRTARYKDYTIISGRGGIVTGEDIKATARFLKKAERSIERLDSQKADLTKVQKAAIAFVDEFQSKTKAEKDMYRNRLSYGFSKYYINHYSKNR